MKYQGVFVTGTDTGIGKTLMSAAMIRKLVSMDFRVAAMKPVASGCDQTNEGLRNEDATMLMQESNLSVEYKQVNPYAFEPPVSPHFAAAAAGERIELENIRSDFSNLTKLADFTVVEGVGGWCVPLNEKDTVADLAKLLDLSVILVVGLRLGCINHAILSAEAIRRSGLNLFACIASQLDREYLFCDETLKTLEDSLRVQTVYVPLLTKWQKAADIVEQAGKHLDPLIKSITCYEEL